MLVNVYSTIPINFSNEWLDKLLLNSPEQRVLEGYSRLIRTEKSIAAKKENPGDKRTPIDFEATDEEIRERIEKDFATGGENLIKKITYWNGLFVVSWDDPCASIFQESYEEFLKENFPEDVAQ